MDAKARLLANLANIPNIVDTPKPEVFISGFTLAGPVLTVRSFCNTAYYWDVFFSQNRVIAETFGEAAYPTPETHHHINRAA